MIYHVSKSGNDFNSGSLEHPFFTINKAARTLLPGDTVIVHEGIYREWVNPKFGGTSEHNRISYLAAEGEHVVISGSEVITNWEKVDGTVYKSVVDNSLFGEFNPFAEVLFGDWIEYPTEHTVHLGNVYINGKSMYEAINMDDLYSDEKRAMGPACGVYPDPFPIDDPNGSLYRWFAEVSEKTTTVYANFRDVNPNEAVIEISVRKCCFFPHDTGRNYITVRGFEIANAAPQFAPPTVTQYGAIGPNWSKCWVIENNIIHDSKCTGIAIGNHTCRDNLALLARNKSGHVYQLESTFDALRKGWSKDNIGSHIIKNNTIYNCEQAGIVGNLGCVFSQIVHNHIYDIGKKQEYWGHETGGIKLHAGIDVIIENNYIHDCQSNGIWLDWQAQGTRVTKNLIHSNRQDLFIEVTHGPCTVDNNLFLSELSLINQAQGSAFVNNVFAGYALPYIKTARATPYHCQHSTQVQGYTVVFGGDDRIYNNIYLGKYNGELLPLMKNFNSYCDAYTTHDEYWDKIKSGRLPTSFQTFSNTPQPVYIDTNIYFGKSVPYKKENSLKFDEELNFELSVENNNIILTVDVPERVATFKATEITTNMLGVPRMSALPYDNPDSTEIDFTKDFFGNFRTTYKAGPFAHLKSGKQRFIVWKI